MYTLRGGNSVGLFCLPSEKGSTLKGKNLLPGIKFFPFRVDPISEGTSCVVTQTFVCGGRVCVGGVGKVMRMGCSSYLVSLLEIVRGILEVVELLSHV